MWLLHICIGVSALGCGSGATHSFPNEQACQRSLKEMRVNDSPVAESSAKRSVVAYCVPKQ